MNKIGLITETEVYLTVYCEKCGNEMTPKYCHNSNNYHKVGREMKCYQCGIEIFITWDKK